jgi:hypothetical protein
MPGTGSSVANMPSSSLASESESSNTSCASESSTDAVAGIAAVAVGGALRTALRGASGGRGTAAVGASSAERFGKSELGDSPDTSVAGRSLPVVLLASGEAAAGAPNTPLGPVAAGARELMT